jgi:hypothetical protein
MAYYLIGRDAVRLLRIARQAAQLEELLIRGDQSREDKEFGSFG